MELQTRDTGGTAGAPPAAARAPQIAMAAAAFLQRAPCALLKLEQALVVLPSPLPDLPLPRARCVQVFVFCCAHADQITKYLQQESKWARSRDMVVTPVVSTSCLSVGEAMRIIDDKDIIHNDFVLVSGDTIANIQLAPILEAHKARRAEDKQAIFTMVRRGEEGGGVPRGLRGTRHSGARDKKRARRQEGRRSRRRARGAAVG